MTRSLPHSALGLAARIADGSLSSEELVERSLGRIEETRDLSAFVAVFAASARRAARRVDAARKRGARLAPFAGVPLAVKDQNFIRFHTTRFGSRATLALPSPVDDVLVRRLRRAGFVLVGATSLSEFGVIPVTENLLGPPARNPWDPTRTPGGSSGGSGAAVAAGLVPIAHGADGGGSLRIPASFCGLFTMKPTRGVLPNVHGYDKDRVLYTDGVLATDALDVAAGLDVLRGQGGPADWSDGARAVPRPLRIRVVTTNALCETDPRIVTAVERVAAALRGLGHHVEPLAPLALSLDHFLPLWQRLVGNTPFLRVRRAHPITAWLHTEGRALDKALVARLHAESQAKVDAWHGDADLLLTPTTAIVAPPIGLGDADKAADPRAAFERFVPLAAYTAPFNVSGQPAASIPVGLTPDGLPLGAQLVGHRGEDALVLSVMRQLEAGVALAQFKQLKSQLF